MKSFAELKLDAEKILNLSTAIKQAAASQTAAIAKIEADRTRSSEWKQTEIAAIRNSSTIDEKLREVQARFAEFKADRDLWTLPFYVLSRERILPGTVDAALEAAEAAVRMNFRAELGLMPVMAAKLLVAEAAMRRDWGRVFQGVLVFGNNLPFSLEALPIPAAEAAEDLFYQTEVAFQLASIDAEGLRGLVKSSTRIALGLMQQEYERKRAMRQRGWKLTLDEKKDLGLDKPETLQEMRDPKPMDIELPIRQTGAAFATGAHFEAIAPGEIPGH